VSAAISGAKISIDSHSVGAKIGAVSRPAGSALSLRRLVLVVVAAAAALAVLFTAQDLMRREITGAPLDWARTLATDALDWFAWAVFVPLVFSIGYRHRLDDAGRRRYNAAVWITLGIACSLAHASITGVALRAWGFLPANGPLAGAPLRQFVVAWVASATGFNVIIFSMIAGVFHATMYYRDLRARRARESALEGRLARAELNVLRMQLQPHFLFNALHTISSLVVSDPETAQRVVAALGDLLRSSLDHTAHHEVPLREELAFVERYIAIQQARFRQRLIVEHDVDPRTLDALVPSLVLQPLVENAIRHGIEPHAGGGRVVIRAAAAGNNLDLSVRDDGPNHANNGAHAPAAAGPGQGIGLTNIEARLMQLYGTTASFRTSRDEGGGFLAALSIPLHTVHAPIDTDAVFP
jgi:two-component system, LytTR family, sensor kinase